MNTGVGFGLLRRMGSDDRPNPRDIVIYETLPNTLPRVAGIIRTEPQTPLSHVNLRAVQDAAPNAYINRVLQQTKVLNLIGSYVRYEVTETGHSLRSATKGGSRCPLRFVPARTNADPRAGFHRNHHHTPQSGRLRQLGRLPV